jgi:hypothetical protein
VNTLGWDDVGEGSVSCSVQFCCYVRKEYDKAVARIILFKLTLSAYYLVTCFTLY